MSAAWRSLTVVQMLPTLVAGGVERGTLEVAEALVRRGHRALVISAGGPLTADLERVGAEHIRMPVAAKSPLTLAHVGPVRRLLVDRGADVVHARSRVPAWVAYLAWRRLPAATRPRFVTTVHGLNSVSWYSSVMTRGERVIAVSEAARRYILLNYPSCAEDRVQVIHRGVDPAEFPNGYVPEPAWMESWRRSYPRLEGKRVLTLIGRLTRLKGHHDFITLIGRLRKSGTPAAGVIVGGTDPKRAAYAGELRRRVDREGLADRVFFSGHRSDVREIAAVSDAVLSLSTTPESFGRAVLEALRLGTPVLGYDHGGVGEILRAMYPEGAVPLGDQDELLRRAALVVSAPKRPVAPSDAFLKTTMLEETMALYESLARSSVL